MRVKGQLSVKEITAIGLNILSSLVSERNLGIKNEPENVLDFGYSQCFPIGS